MRGGTEQLDSAGCLARTAVSPEDGRFGSNGVWFAFNLPGVSEPLFSPNRTWQFIPHSRQWNTLALFPTLKPPVQFLVSVTQKHDRYASGWNVSDFFFACHILALHYGGNFGRATLRARFLSPHFIKGVTDVDSFFSSRA